MHTEDDRNRMAEIEVLRQAAGRRILCLGDVMLDRFIMGRATRISPEGPHPVFEPEAERDVPGGAANVACNIAALGVHCALVGVSGQDAAFDDLSRALAAIPGLAPILVADPERQTTVKTRYRVDGQTLLRVDRESTQPLSSSLEERLIASVREELGKCDALVISDYAKGLITDRLLREAIAAARRAGLPIVVDPKAADLTRYSGASLLTPNLAETRRATALPLASEVEIAEAGEQLRQDAKVDALLVTRAAEGLTLVAGGDIGAVHIPASPIRTLFDVVGAGDTVAAVMAIGLAGGADLECTARLANRAAGLVVAKRETAVVTAAELAGELDGAGGPSSLRSTKKRRRVVSRSAAGDLAASWKAQGKRLGFTNGVFDILHPGHLAVLEFAKAACDVLIVGVNSDSSARRLEKGEDRPVNPENDRATLLAGLEAVDLVVVFDEDTPEALISELCPDVLVKGADYAPDKVAGADVVLAAGGQVLLAPLLADKSSTAIFEKIRQAKVKAGT